MSDIQEWGLSLEQVDDYEFRVRFDATPVPDLLTDELAPLGGDVGPNPSQLLLAAVANCLAASLLFALRKFKNDPGTLRASARATTERNTAGRWRVRRVAVDLQLSDATADLQHLQRILQQFEEFCVVTQSVREGMVVDVSVHDGQGVLCTEVRTQDGPEHMQ